MREKLNAKLIWAFCCCGCCLTCLLEMNCTFVCLFALFLFNILLLLLHCCAQYIYSLHKKSLAKV